MEYKEIAGTYSCECKNGYTRYGNVCIAEYEFDILNKQLPNGGVNQAKKVTFYNILQSDGISVKSSGEFTSDVFSEFFVDGAIGCIVHNNPSKC